MYHKKIRGETKPQNGFNEIYEGIGVGGGGGSSRTTLFACLVTGGCVLRCGVLLLSRAVVTVVLLRPVISRRSENLDAQNALTSSRILLLYNTVVLLYKSSSSRHPIVQL